MKKRKFPVVLMLVLAGLFGAVAFMMKPQGASGPEPAPDTNKPADSSDAVGGDVSKKMGDAKAPPTGKPKMPAAPTTSPGAPGPGKMPMHGGPGGNMPTLLKAPVGITKPQMNDSSTSTQWYTTESARNNPKK